MVSEHALIRATGGYFGRVGKRKKYRKKVSSIKFMLLFVNYFVIFDRNDGSTIDNRSSRKCLISRRIKNE